MPSYEALADQAGALVSAWYWDETTPQADGIVLSVEKAALLEQIQSRPELAELFANKLLCSILCEFNRRRHGHLPTDDLVEIYTVIGNELVDRRPPSSSGRPPRGAIDGGNALLLQLLAGLMLIDDLVTLDRAAASEAIAAELPWPLLGRIEGTAEEVLDELLHETSALALPPSGGIEFVHPAVRHHFGALYLADKDCLDQMLSRAHQPEWYAVIHLTAARLRRPEFTELMGRLADRADSEPQHTRYLDLLAVQCVKSKRSVDPALAIAIEERAARHRTPSV
ncbi:hypothetical protein [Streptomyces sp. NPDC051572]|uniref:hypothetical protein n=1 Tax=Streptomyces sp. NPDC051572 TaxID=3155802 RepID=UPI003450842B